MFYEGLLLGKDLFSILFASVLFILMKLQQSYITFRYISAIFFVNILIYKEELF